MGKLAKSVNILLRVKEGFREDIKARAKAANMAGADLIREAVEILLKIPEDQFLKLHRRCEEEGLSLSAVIREAIQPYVAADESAGKGALAQPTHFLSILRQRSHKK